MMNDTNEKRASFVIISEILFAILPIVAIVSIIIVTSEEYSSIFTRSEFSFISVFFFGQTLVKLISGVSRSKAVKNWQIIMLFVSLIIILGLVPSVVWLCIIFLGIHKYNFIYILQFIWFLFSLFTYFIIGKVGQMYIDEENEKSS
jgi:hypothetical protein